MGRVIVMTVNNHPTYFNQMKAAVMSLAANAPDEEVIAYLVDFDDEVDLSEVNPNCKTVHRKLGLDKVPKSKRSGHMSCFRSCIVLEALEEGDDAVAYMDSDIIVRKNLHGFWEGVVPSTLKVMVRPDEPTNARIQCGIFALGNSDATLEMIREYNEIIQKENVFLREQEELYLTHQRHNDTVVLVELPSVFNVWKFRPDSVIWHCKNKHFKNKKFQKEWLEYLRAANELLH